MKNKFLYCLFALFVVNTVFIGCKKDLTVVPNDILPDEAIFTDKNLITATLARFYQQVDPTQGNGWGQNNRDWNTFQQDPDDGINNNGGVAASALPWSRDRYKIFDYALIRRLNQFLEGIRSDASKKAMTATENNNFEGQAIFLRAYTYFHMVKTLGGVTIVNDEVFTYASGMDIQPLQKPRNSESDCYKYIMTQCDEAYSKLNIPNGSNINMALANKWAARMLKARAALTAASIARWTPINAPLNVKQDNFGTNVVGIPATEADFFYKEAFAAAKDVIDNSGYQIMKGSTVEAAQTAFYKATSVKDGNTEVIWAQDRKLPNSNTQWTRHVAPRSHSDMAEGNSLGATLNLVEAFERKDGTNPTIQTRTGANNASGTYIVYNDVEDPFKARDARLWGTVIWPNALYRGTPVPLKAGELRKNTLPLNNPVFTVVVPPAKGNPAPITSVNGPADVTTNFINKTGFAVRKWLDETPNAGLQPNYSDMWWVKFRLAEAYTIAAESAFFASNLGPAVGLPYINFLRDRGKIQPLTLANFTFEKIVNECRVEFAFEDHRMWDLNRWRLSHIYWDGSNTGLYSQPMSLYAFQINIAGSPDNGKWVFDRRISYRRQNTAFTFGVGSYYATITQTWVNPNNPNWVLNPGQ